MSFYYGETVLDPIALKPYLWNRADAVSVDGSNRVSAFDDLAGNGNYLNQGTADNQAVLTNSFNNLNNRPTVKFDGVTNNYTSVSDCLLNSEPEWEIYIIHDFVTPTVDFGDIGSTTGVRFFFTNKQARFRIKESSGTFRTTNPSAGVGNITQFRFKNVPTIENSSMRTRVDLGTEVNSSIQAGGIDNANGTLRFGHSSVQSVPYDGYLAEIILFKRWLSPRESKHIYHYFGQRYKKFNVRR